MSVNVVYHSFLALIGGYTNIGQRSEGQELLLKVHHFIFSSAKDSSNLDQLYFVK